MFYFARWLMLFTRDTHNLNTRNFNLPRLDALKSLSKDFYDYLRARISMMSHPSVVMVLLNFLRGLLDITSQLPELMFISQQLIFISQQLNQFPPTISGPMDQMNSGTMRQMNSGTMRQMNSGTMHQMNSGPMDQMNSGSMDQMNSGTMHQMNSGTMHQMNSRPMDQMNSGPMVQMNSGSMHQMNSGSMHQMSSAPMHQLSQFSHVHQMSVAPMHMSSEPIQQLHPVNSEQPVSFTDMSYAVSCVDENSASDSNSSSSVISSSASDSNSSSSVISSSASDSNSLPVSGTKRVRYSENLNREYKLYKPDENDGTSPRCTYNRDENGEMTPRSEMLYMADQKDARKGPSDNALVPEENIYNTRETETSPRTEGELVNAIRNSRLVNTASYNRYGRRYIVDAANAALALASSVTDNASSASSNSM